MRFLLQPKRDITFGQDFLAKAMREKCNLTVFDPNAGNPPPGSLVVSQNPDSFFESDIIDSLPSGVAVVIHVHCKFSFFDNEQQQRIARSVSRATIGIAPAQFSTSDLAQRFPHLSWRTVYNGIDRERFRPTTIDERRSWKRQRNIPENRLLVGFVGRLVRTKGLQILEKFAQMLSSNSRVHLFIQFLDTTNTEASIQSEVQRLLQLAPGRVTCFQDKNPCDDRPVRYFDALFTPSLSEVCPLVVLEAFNCGVPVLATRCTPFYSELEQFSWPEGYLNLRNLPQGIGSSHSQLTVSDEESKQLGQQFIEISERLQIADDNFRNMLSRCANNAGFAQTRMLEKLDEIYSEAVT